MVRRPRVLAAARVLVLLCALCAVPLAVWAQEPAPIPSAKDGDNQGPAGIRISNFVSGPVCQLEDGRREICEQAVDIEVSGESRCNWAGQERRCTWFGFQFDYEDADPTTPIVCSYTRSRPSNEGNRDGVRQRNAMEGTYTLELEAESGHLFNQGYEVYDIPPGGGTVVVTNEI